LDKALVVATPHAPSPPTSGMPPYQEVEAHLAAVLEGERRHTAKRVAREKARVEWATQAAERQVSAASAQAEAATALARAEADEVVARAEERLRVERERCARELNAAQEREAAAAAEATERVRAAEAARDAALPDITARVARADEVRRGAVAAAEAAAVDAEALASTRVADAERRQAAAGARAARLRAEAQAREKRRVQEVEHRVAALEDDARRRAEQVERAAAEAIEVHLERLRSRLHHAESEWASIQEREDAEVRRARRQAAAESVLVSEVRACGQHCSDLAEKTRTLAKANVDEVMDAHARWRANKAQLAAEELQAREGLEELAQCLRAGNII